MDQPQSDGVAPVGGFGRICSKSEGERRSWRADGEGTGLDDIYYVTMVAVNWRTWLNKYGSKSDTGHNYKR